MVILHMTNARGLSLQQHVFSGDTPHLVTKAAQSVFPLNSLYII